LKAIVNDEDWEVSEAAAAIRLGASGLAKDRVQPRIVEVIVADTISFLIQFDFFILNSFKILVVN
jgi:hypothetical protein